MLRVLADETRGGVGGLSIRGRQVYFDSECSKGSVILSRKIQPLSGGSVTPSRAYISGLAHQFTAHQSVKNSDSAS
jgi:hypothetical protein